MPEEQKTVDVGEQSEAEDLVEVELDSSTKPPAEEASVQGELALEKEEPENQEELETYSESVQKRISKLTAKMREAERREKAALDYAKGVKTQLDQTEARTSSLDQSLVTEFENRVTAQEEVFKAQNLLQLLQTPNVLNMQNNNKNLGHKYNLKHNLKHRYSHNQHPLIQRPKNGRLKMIGLVKMNL